jgi:hypothetical protein
MLSSPSIAVLWWPAVVTSQLSDVRHPIALPPFTHPAEVAMTTASGSLAERPGLSLCKSEDEPAGPGRGRAGRTRAIGPRPGAAAHRGIYHGRTGSVGNRRMLRAVDSADLWFANLMAVDRPSRRHRPMRRETSRRDRMEPQDTCSAARSGDQRRLDATDRRSAPPPPPPSSVRHLPPGTLSVMTSWHKGESS